MVSQDCGALNQSITFSWPANSSSSRSPVKEVVFTFTADNSSYTLTAVELSVADNGTTSYHTDCQLVTPLLVSFASTDLDLVMKNENTNGSTADLKLSHLHFEAFRPANFSSHGSQGNLKCSEDPLVWVVLAVLVAIVLFVMVTYCCCRN